MMSPAPLPFVRPRAIHLRLAAALLAAVADVLFAAAYGQWSLPAVLRSIATWVLGPAARHGGAAAARCGAALEAAPMVAMHGGYAALARRHPALLAHPVRDGLAYGALLYALQFGVLVPLSPAPPAGAFDPLWHVACCGRYMRRVGVPAACIARMAATPAAPRGIATAIAEAIAVRRPA